MTYYINMNVMENNSSMLIYVCSFAAMDYYVNRQSNNEESVVWWAIVGIAYYLCCPVINISCSSSSPEQSWLTKAPVNVTEHENLIDII